LERWNFDESAKGYRSQEISGSRVVRGPYLPRYTGYAECEDRVNPTTGSRLRHYSLLMAPIQ
jgi:hypothetical protein